MKYVDNRLALLIFCLVCPLLFLPKIKMISVGDGPGIRADDVFLFFAFSIIMFSHAITRAPLNKIEASLLIFTGLSITSFFVSKFLGAIGAFPSSSNPLYALRMVEYFVFFYAGCCALKFLSMETIVLAILFENIVVCLLQKLGMIGGYTVNGYVPKLTTRVIGVTSGDYELGILLIVIFCFLMSSDRRFLSQILRFPQKLGLLSNPYTRSVLILLAIFPLLMFSGSRVSFLSILGVFLIKVSWDLYSNRQKGFVIFFWSAFVVSVASLFVFMPDFPLIARFNKILNLANLKAFVDIFAEINLEDTSFFEFGKQIDFFHGVGVTLDHSWFCRVYKWGYALKLIFYNPYCLFIGLGPGFFGPALDGGWLRLFVEHGFVGSASFFMIFYQMYKINPKVVWFFLGFAVNMIFIDTYMAYKGMSVFLFIAGGMCTQGSLVENQVYPYEKQPAI